MIPQAGELLALGFEGTTLPEDIADLAAEAGLGGVVLFARNCPTLDAVLSLTAAARGLGPDVLVLVDHEGGRVHRLPPPFTRFPPAATVGRTGEPALAARVARAMARELRAAGFDSGLTPVLDCRTDPAKASSSATGPTRRTPRRSRPAARRSPAQPWRRASSRWPSTSRVTGGRPSTPTWPSPRWTPRRPRSTGRS